MCIGTQVFVWLNLLTMCIFLAHAASGVVLAILDDCKPKAAQADGEEESAGEASLAGKDDAWIEGSGVPDAFLPSRRTKHWRHGYGFAIAVDTEKEKPYLVCFASGLARWCVLQRNIPAYPHPHKDAHTFTQISCIYVNARVCVGVRACVCVCVFSCVPKPAHTDTSP